MGDVDELTCVCFRSVYSFEQALNFECVIFLCVKFTLYTRCFFMENIEHLSKAHFSPAQAEEALLVEAKVAHHAVEALPEQ